MEIRPPSIGDSFEHPLHGAGTVSFVGTDYLGIRFADGREALIRRDALERPDKASGQPNKSSQRALTWPESTFTPEAPGKEHFLGSHWDAFYEDAQSDVIARLPEILSQSVLQTGSVTSNWAALRRLPAAWPRAHQLVWPGHEQGMAMIFRLHDEQSTLVSLFPFTREVSRCRLRLREVTVWIGALEAQITAGWGEADVTFFDTEFLIHRASYVTGEEFDFLLSGLAYAAGPAEHREYEIEENADVVAWHNRNLAEGEEPYPARMKLILDDMAAFLPVPEWDVDDYSFHGPVKAVTEFSDWLGQDGWRVRTTVMRFTETNEGQDADLDILITRRAWNGDAPPSVGQVIEGRLWLHGCLAD